MQTYKRWQSKVIIEALKYRRIIILSGSRQCGKTTLAKYISSSDTIYRNLDDIQLLEASLIDPEGFVAHQDELMIIDEIQRSPSLLQAVKKNVDENQNYGRFLLTGSANIHSLPSITESLAGRTSNIRLRPLSIGEIRGKDPVFIQNAFSGSIKIDHLDKNYNKDDYLRMCLIGGYPEANHLPQTEVSKWHNDYLNALIERDLKDIMNIRRKDNMHKLLRILAAWSTKEINIESIGASLSIKRPTLESYINALEALYLVDRVKAWPSTDYEGVRKKDKLIFSDTGLMASSLQWIFGKIQFDSERNGKIIETFVYNQLISILEAQEDNYNIYHYRDAAKREIDFLVENIEGNILGIEIKAGSAVKKSHFKHLEWFKNNLAQNNKFQGIIFYTGNDIISFGDNMLAVPIRSLWS